MWQTDWQKMVESLKTGEMSSSLQRRRIRHAEVFLTRSRRQKGPHKSRSEGWTEWWLQKVCISGRPQGSEGVEEVAEARAALDIQLKNGSRNMETHILLMLPKPWSGVHKSLDSSMGDNDLLRSRYRACSLVPVLPRTLSSPLVLIPPFLSSKYSSHIQTPAIRGFIFSMLKPPLWYFLSQKNKNTIWWVDSELKLQSKWQTWKILSSSVDTWQTRPYLYEEAVGMKAWVCNPGI